jgi:hypothetical protein
LLIAGIKQWEVVSLLLGKPRIAQSFEWAGAGVSWSRGGSDMTEIQVDGDVQLTQDIPELGLHCGEIGRVCSTWFGGAYEVEFRREMPHFSIRALLVHGQLAEKAQKHEAPVAMPQYG